jgi:hypothetical protein
MTKKPLPPGMEESEIPYQDDESAELTDAEWDAWFARNGEA